MPEALERYALLFVVCALSGTAIPMPEDVALVGAGATVDHPAAFAGMTLAAMGGLLIRDSVFFLLGHAVGEGIFRWPLVQRLVGPARVQRGRELVESQGGRAVLISRFLVGIRSTGFLAAGAMGVRIRDFFFWDLVGLAISVPLALLLGYALGEPILVGVSWVLERKGLVAAVAIAGIAVWAWRTFRAPPGASPGGEGDEPA
ncbi:MAG: VTT domain-containing protein [Myxococcota bacterium]